MALENYAESIDYEWIKRAAKAQGVSVNEYIVLAPQNDPFYTGTPNDRALGEWFAQVWQRQGESRAHIRRVHYYLVSLGEVTFPNGKPYENTVECWDTLNMASKAARYLQLVDPAAFNDRRTPEVMLYAPASKVVNPSVTVFSPTYSLGMRLPDFPHLPMYSIEDFTAPQPYHLEIWCEKSTMNDVLGPLCERYGANLQTGMGEMSITATLALVHRLQQSGKPARILYVSDFDPAGQSMPVAVSRKIEYFVRTLGIDLDVRLFPVVLTLEQVQYYQLPRTPIKETERRRVGFEQRHGEGAVELDALEALYPGQLQDILSQYLDAYYDWSLEERIREQRHALQEELGEAWQVVTEQYREELEALRENYRVLKEGFEPRMQHMSSQLRNLWQAVKLDLEHYTGTIANYPVPQPEVEEEIGEGLYSSERDYLTQIEAYKQFQGRA
jgi:hypothetical protein